MKLSLVIPGNNETSNAVCRVMEDMGFLKTPAEDGIYIYSGLDSDVLDIVVLDWEPSETKDFWLKKTLHSLKKNRESMILFCQNGKEREYLEKAIGSDQQQDWLLRPFCVENLAQHIGSSRH